MSIKWTMGEPPDEVKDGRDICVYIDGELYKVFWFHGWSCKEDMAPVDMPISGWSDINPPGVIP